MPADLAHQRSKKACISCRQRKRKCNGERPCSYCRRNEHTCEYGQPPTRTARQRQRIRDKADSVSDEQPSQLQLLEANSASVFVRQLGLKINPASAPPFGCYAWNLGLADEARYLPRTPGSVREFCSVDQMREMTAQYFTHVAPVYDFLDRDYVEAAVSRRWQAHPVNDAVDAMLCGVAALGALFSGQPDSLKTKLVQSARGALEYSSTLASPELDHVLGWLLRVIYLRATSSPQATWMACCTLMHMIETTKLHLEPSDNCILAQSSRNIPGDLRRRIYWVAQLFNVWVSFDFGKSSVELRGASSEFPTSSWTTEQRTLCQMSYTLGRKLEFEPSEIDSELSTLCDLHPSQPMLQLLQCNIGLCHFRQLRALGWSMSEASLNSLLGLASSSLSAVAELIDRFHPWWHVVNIPFQLVCVLLVIDTDRALELLAKALDGLKAVMNKFPTSTTKETYQIACYLVTQERQRRLCKVERLATALVGHSLPPPKPSTDALDVDYYPLPGADTLFDPILDLNGPMVDYFFFGQAFPQI